jgi:hypothetical protein
VADSQEQELGRKPMPLLLIPTNAYLAAAIIFGLITSLEVMLFATITVLFVETMKTLIMATKAKNAVLEFGLSLTMLIVLVLYVQSANAWGLNMITACLYIQFLDTFTGFIGTFLLARRDFGS